MPKKTRALRLSDRTWNQLEALAPWLQVGDRTKAIEVLAEKESVIMATSQNERILRAYRIGQKINAEHPGTSQVEEATITSLTADLDGRLDGIIVRFSDGVFIPIDAKYLEPDGSGM